MSLNKQRGNLYDFVSHSWNPIKGCAYNCEYCYLKSMPNFNWQPRLDEKCMNDSLGKGKTIFVGSAADMFGNFMHDEWIRKVLKKCRDNAENKYLFQTKNPGRYMDFLDEFPVFTILATTIETNRLTDLISKAPIPSSRAIGMALIPHRLFRKIMITIEPALEWDTDVMYQWIELLKPSFVNIGIDSKRHHMRWPQMLEIIDLIKRLRGITEVKIKSNLVNHYGDQFETRLEVCNAG